MLRQLLTLLAFVTGFVAVIEPAQAAHLAAGVESVSQAEQGAACMAAPVGLMAEGKARRAQQPGEKFCPRPVISVVIPTVQLQADRARE